MVSKMAVIAIVAIVAAPILTGYLMAFEDVERARYNPDDTKNVTDLVMNDSTYTYMSANSYTLNSNVWVGASVNRNPDISNYEKQYPIYREVSTTYTSVPMARSSSIPATFTISDYSYAEIRLNDQISAANHITVTINGGNLNGQTTDYFIGLIYYSYRYDHPQILTYNYVTEQFGSIDARQATSLSFNASGYTGSIEFDYVLSDGSSNGMYANTTSGYNPYISISGNSYLDDGPLTYDTAEWVPQLHSSSILVTADLRDLTPYSNGYLQNVGFKLSAWSYGTAYNEYYELARIEVKQSSGTWMINDTAIYRSDDPDRNVWQFRITNGNVEAAYVGAWPNTLGPAYAYQTITVPFESQDPDADIQTLSFLKSSPTNTERVRVDAATTRSAPIPVIKDQTYSPTMLNDAADGYVTELSKVGQSGPSIEFAGNTYTVTDGRITVGTKKVPLEGLTFRSEKDDNGNVINYIGGIRVANTASIPAVTLNGTWAMIVQTTYLDMEIVTVTEWVPGQFAWNGVDESFALIGLISCVATFIGLGMYGRRSGAKVGVLMLITGCAAFIFLAMI